MSNQNLVVVIVGMANLILLIWFVYSVNKINASLVTIAIYQRRTALALPLTSGQAKLINRSFTPIELIAVLQKQGAVLRIEGHDFEGITRYSLKIDQNRAVDPEIVDLAFLWENAILEVLKQDHTPKNIV